MSQQPKIECSISQILTMMTKKVKQHPSEACAIKERHLAKTLTDLIWQFVNVGIYNILLLGPFTILVSFLYGV